MKLNVTAILSLQQVEDVAVDEEEKKVEDVRAEDASEALLEGESEKEGPLFGTEENKAKENLTQLDKKSDEEDTSDDETKSQWSDTNPFIET